MDTLAGIRQVTPVLERGKVTRARVSMGAPQFHPDEIPVVVDPDLCREGWPYLQYPVTVQDTSLAMSFVSMGNPHAVAFIQQGVADFPCTPSVPWWSTTRCSRVGSTSRS